MRKERLDPSESGEIMKPRVGSYLGQRTLVVAHFYAPLSRGEACILERQARVTHLGKYPSHSRGVVRSIRLFKVSPTPIALAAKCDVSAHFDRC